MSFERFFFMGLSTAAPVGVHYTLLFSATGFFCARSYHRRRAVPHCSDFDVFL
jgi:hypothetical protein